ncbi:MAG: 5-methyltetrahydropteroyltriglutamate--homocysteine S-methyltransferase, partial [Coleofasciculus sp. C2-GNP5-27]
MSIQTATVGYPRIGKNREVKKALESFWSNKLDAESLWETVRQVEETNWQTQREAGINRIGIGDATLYDSVLDWSIYLGLIPERFRHLSGLEQYFAMARGKEGIPALEMTKWFDTNYHYLVPEISAPLQPTDFNPVLATVKHAQHILGKRATPIILGPMTLLRLSRLDMPIAEIIRPLCDRYVNLLQVLKPLGIEEV